MFKAFPLSRLVTGVIVFAIGACNKGDLTNPPPPPDQIVFTGAQINSLDSTVRTLEQNNASYPTVRALVDSALLVLTAGVVAKRLDVTTDLTTAPLYFVGVHRVYMGAASGSTWTVVGMDDPSHLTSIVEIGAFAPTNTESLGGALGGVLNGLLLSVGTAGTVTEWFASSGTASISSSASGTACPNFPTIPRVTCTLETMHVSFAMVGAGASPTSGSRQASLSPVDVPAMRLTYSIP